MSTFANRISQMARAWASAWFVAPGASTAAGATGPTSRSNPPWRPGSPARPPRPAVPARCFAVSRVPATFRVRGTQAQPPSGVAATTQSAGRLQSTQQGAQQGTLQGAYSGKPLRQRQPQGQGAQAQQALHVYVDHADPRRTRLAGSFADVCVALDLLVRLDEAADGADKAAADLAPRPATA